MRLGLARPRTPLLTAYYCSFEPPVAIFTAFAFSRVRAYPIRARRRSLGSWRQPASNRAPDHRALTKTSYFRPMAFLSLAQKKRHAQTHRTICQETPT